MYWRSAALTAASDTRTSSSDAWAIDHLCWISVDRAPSSVVLYWSLHVASSWARFGIGTFCLFGAFRAARVACTSAAVTQRLKEGGSSGTSGGVERPFNGETPITRALLV